MTDVVTKDNLFRPGVPKARTKADTTNSIARTIIETDAVTREAKTARLRQARLIMEAQQPPPVLPKSRGKKAPKRKLRSAA